MAKRVADKYLTDQNWDQEDEDEDEPGCFQKADDEVLKTRVIRKAKRRVVGAQQSSGSAFSEFGGLKAPTAKAASMFGGFSLPGNANLFKGFGGFTSAGSSAAAHFKLQPSTVAVSAVVPEPSAIPTVGKQATESKVKSIPVMEVKSSDDEENSHTLIEYNRHLAALNKSVTDWIKNHVEKNPLCDLTPIFHDYKKHLLEIDERFGQSDNETSQNSFQVSDSQETVSPKSSKDSSRSSNTSEKSKFSLTGFGQKPNESKEKDSKSKPPIAPSMPLFTRFQTTISSAPGSPPFKGFNVENKPPSVPPGFSFSSSMVWGSATTSTAKPEGDGGEGEYEPPKPESNIVEEKDAFFTIRCKLYYKKGDAFTDRGVGQLYLKPTGDNTQLLVRADTTIGQILLNILIQPSIPMLRQGKNNVMITCIPNPPVDEKEKDKVVPMLIRVKTGDDADRLLKIMEEKKQEAQSKANSDG